MINTTLNLLKEKDACEDGYKTLLEHVGLHFDKDEKIPLTTILESNNLDDTLWVLDNAPLEIEDAKILRLYFGSWCVKQVLPIYEKEHPNDERVRKCIDVTILFTKGEATQSELNAAREAARWAAREAARWAAGAARGDAWAARGDAWAARDVGDVAQSVKLKEMLEGDTPKINKGNIK